MVLESEVEDGDMKRNNSSTVRFVQLGCNLLTRQWLSLSEALTSPGSRTCRTSHMWLDARLTKHTGT